ncbi:MAG: hypothetical protein HDR48_03655 [Bacteroides sp.]|nr:hypothetical protein [Bacteroides sp.]
MNEEARKFLEAVGLNPDDVPGGLIALERRISQQIIFPGVMVNQEMSDDEKYGLWVVKRIYDYITRSECKEGE